MIKTVIFDMDGVLIDSETHYANEEIKLFRDFGINIDKETAKEYMGTPFSIYFPEIFKRFNMQIPTQKILDKYNQVVSNIYMNLVILNPQAKKALEVLKSKYQLALATSTSDYLAEIVLKRFSLSKYFKVKVFGNQVKKGKPFPDIYLKVLDLLSVNSINTIAIEDSFNGIKSAKGAGLKVIAYKTDHNQEVDFSRADFIIEDLREIPKILERVNQVTTNRSSDTL